MYREIQRAEQAMQRLEGEIHTAILATNTRDITMYAGQAQATAVQISRELDGALATEDTDIQRTFVTAARNTLNDSVTAASKVALGSSAEEMRARLLDVKTRADFANAYLRAALGSDTS